MTSSNDHFQGEMHFKKKVAESNAAQMMLDSDDFKEYLKHLDKQWAD